MLCLHNFTGVYEKQDFYKDYSYELFNDRALNGVRGYMDEEARKYLLEEIKERSNLSSIHLLDSGNYHHLSRVYLDLIKEPFNLVVYDNHTDMQFSAFGNILSCGSWIADAYESLDYLKKIIIIGASSKYIDDCAFNKDERVIFADGINEVSLGNELPIYISVDKDVISENEFISDWDQGIMPVSTLIKELKCLRDSFRIVGVDICGEPDKSDDINISLSNNINKELVNIFVDILY
jgi:hypothetical protein